MSDGDWDVEPGWTDPRDTRTNITRSPLRYRRHDVRGESVHQIQTVSFRTKGVIEFLRHVLFHVPGKILIMWDGAKIHKSKGLSIFLEMDTIHRMTFEHFPPYAPEVDPQEYVWRHLKHV